MSFLALWRRLRPSPRHPLAGLALLLLATSSAATDTLNLSTAMAKTLALHPALNVFALRQQSLHAQSQSAQQRPGYRLDIEAENFAGSGAFGGFDNADISLSLSSTLELGGKRAARAASASAGLALLNTQRELQALQLLGELTRRYIDALAAQQRIALAESGVALAETSLAQVQRRARAGAVPKAEIKRAEAALGQAQLSLHSEQNSARNALTSLAALWGEAELDARTQLQGELFLPAQDRPFAQLYQQLQNHPAVAAFTEQRRLKAAALRLQQSERRFDIDWSVGLRRFQGSDDSALLAGISLPLFSQRRGQGAVSAARAELAQVDAEQQAALWQLRAQLQRAYNNRQQAMHTVQQLRQQIIPALQVAVAETRTAYERGRYSYRDYASAIVELVAARRRAIDAAAAALRYRAEIEQMTAQSLSAITPIFQD
ncbi:MAG: RND transporter [Gammaproteobacteria bacterium]|nr:MAG: RND transporter [Gammaproteobacteria bacterium]